MTPTTVRVALVEGDKADGVIVDHDAFDIDAVDGGATSRASDEVIATVLGTQEGAIAAGHHLVSTGVAWTDRAEAAVLREALVARGIENVLLVSELHAAAALAQAAGRAVGYDKTGLMFVERETATLAVIDTADGSVVKVLSECLHGDDALAVVAEMVTDLNVQKPAAQGLFVVGSGVDVTAVKAHLTDLVAVSVIAPEDPSSRWRAARRWRPRMHLATTRLLSAWPTRRIPTAQRPTQSWWPIFLATTMLRRMPAISLRSRTTSRNAASRSCW